MYWKTLYDTLGVKFFYCCIKIGKEEEGQLTGCTFECTATKYIWTFSVQHNSNHLWRSHVALVMSPGLRFNHFNVICMLYNTELLAWGRHPLMWACQGDNLLACLLACLSKCGKKCFQIMTFFLEIYIVLKKYFNLAKVKTSILTLVP